MNIPVFSTRGLIFGAVVGALVGGWAGLNVPGELKLSKLSVFVAGGIGAGIIAGLLLQLLDWARGRSVPPEDANGLDENRCPSCGCPTDPDGTVCTECREPTQKWATRLSWLNFSWNGWNGFAFAWFFIGCMAGLLAYGVAGHFIGYSESTKGISWVVFGGTMLVGDMAYRISVSRVVGKIAIVHPGTGGWGCLSPTWVFGILIVVAGIVIFRAVGQ